MKKLRKSIAVLLVMMMAALTGGVLTGCGGSSGEAGEVNIYMWSEYMAPTLAEQFEEETGIKVNFSYMSTTEEAVAKITSGGGSEYDLIMPSDADMTSLIEGGYLEEINLDNLPNFDNLDDAYKYREFDPENKYAIPYLMNYVYVIYNKDKCPIEITSYNDLLKPEMKGQISSVTGVRNLFAMALAAQGLDPNSKDEADIEKAYEWCLEYSKNVVAFDSDSPETLLINGGATAAYVFDGQVTKAINETKAGSGDEIVIAEFDEDPIQLGVDEFVIPAGAKNKENAEAFLNFLLDADVMASNLQYMYDEEGNVVSCPNAAALDLMSDEYRSSPAINLPEKMKNNYYLQLDVGDAAKIYDEYWTKFQSEAGEVE
ncbi:MAG: spermidine/putrescine ABC transporter substrate-binding protein [Clostridiales bacterium]|nr:spermidine/putrescine ABC transporter substrate-binding protein [Clostridiales bacterium]MBQ3321448.1 spermidine/putrescine ABC transporter substrate-binding protein [Bacillota bacterium]